MTTTLSQGLLDIIARERHTPTPAAPVEVLPEVVLSDEQQRVIDVVASGRDVIVDACVGAGKTTTIQALCALMGRDHKVLYLTYSKLLKADAQRRVGSAKVQNYHGVVYPSLRDARISCGIAESVRAFNASFKTLSATFPAYDLLVVDEYQDINEEYAELLRNIKSINPLMQVVMVGDMAQKVKSDTTLDVEAFTLELCDNPERLPFTQSFRAGPELGALLGQAWNKPIVGMNTGQRMRTVSMEEAVQIISAHAPGDLLCLGKRNGSMSTVLNQVEARNPVVFNKSTVFASIRDGDSAGTYDANTAVFTTFDSSKGLERKVCIVFDYDEANWDVRNNFAGADPVILRNVFLVAASRGKEEVIFVRGPKAGTPLAGEKMIGSIPVRRFTKLPKMDRPRYDKPLWTSDAFDFKYAENVEACFELLDVERLDSGDSEVIEIDRNDGLIDLSPAVGHYQEAVFFDRYDAKAEIAKNPSLIAEVFASELSGDVWKDTLVLASVSTGQARYAEQVTRTIDDTVRDALVARLGTLLPSHCQSQVQMVLSGVAAQTKAIRTPIQFAGVADAVYDGQVFELKFVTELSRAMFLQLALYLVMSNLESGVLWNTRTDERWEVRIPDRKRFMNAVILCVSKQAYRAFEPA